MRNTSDMKINLFNNYGQFDLDYESIIAAVEKQFPGPEEASLILVGSEEIHSLNKEFRNVDRPTDVLSFEGEEENYLGDIFICVEKVFSQAQEYGHGPEREFAFLLVHGLLHLQGYDHGTPEEEKTMIQRQEEILKAMNYRRNI